MLVSQGRRPPASFSLTSPVPEPPPGEAAVADLLRTVQLPRPDGPLPNIRKSKLRLPSTSFLSGALPRDRRGRIGQKGKKRQSYGEEEVSEEREVAGEGAATPRHGRSRILDDRSWHNEKELLEALRSANPFFSFPNRFIFFSFNFSLCGYRSPGTPNMDTRPSTGESSGGANEENAKGGKKDEVQVESLNWDEAQVFARSQNVARFWLGV